MTTINITNARKDLFQLVDSCIKYNDVVNINTKNGNVVLINEDEYRGMLATLELSAVSGMKSSILEGAMTPTEELKEFSWDD